MARKHKPFIVHSFVRKWVSTNFKQITWGTWLISVLKYLKKVFRPLKHSVAEPYGNKSFFSNVTLLVKMKFCFVFVSKNAICHKIVDIDHKFLSCHRPIRGWFSIFSKKFLFLANLKSALVLSRTRHTITDGIILNNESSQVESQLLKYPQLPADCLRYNTGPVFFFFFFMRGKFSSRVTLLGFARVLHSSNYL